MIGAEVVIAAATEVERNGWSLIPQPVEWGKDPHIPGMVFATWKFDNGFGASVIAGPALGYVELAVLDTDGNLTYSTPITDDVERVSSKAELMDLLVRIQAL